MMGDFKVLGIIVIILLCEGVQNRELKAGSHFLNLFERVLEPSPPLFQSPSLRHPQEWASAFRNYWSSLIRDRLPIIGWGNTEEDESELGEEDMKHVDIDAPIVTEHYDAVTSSEVPATTALPAEGHDTNKEHTSVKSQSLGVTVTDIQFTNTPPVKVVTAPHSTLEIPLHPPTTSHSDHGLQASVHPALPARQPSLLDILLQDYLCKSSSYSNCEYLINIKHEPHPGNLPYTELPLVLHFRRPSIAMVNNEKKGPYSNTPAPHYQVNIKDILSPEAYSTIPLKVYNHESSSYTPPRVPEVTSYTSTKQVTPPYTPVDTTKYTTQVAYTTTPVPDKTTSYPHSEIPEVTHYTKTKEVTTEAAITTYTPRDVTKYTTKASYTTFPTTERHHETTSYPTTESTKVSTYSPSKEITTVTTPLTHTEYTTKASYTTNPTTPYYKETTAYTSTATPHYSSLPSKEALQQIRTSTDSDPTPYAKVDKIEHTSQESYSTIPTTEYHHETHTHVPVDVPEVSTQEQAIPIRNNDRLTNLNSPKNSIKHSSQTSYTTQHYTTGMTSTYTPVTTTERTGGSETEKYSEVYTTSAPTSEKYADSVVEHTEKYTTNSPYSESTVALAGPESTSSELSHDLLLAVSLNDNSHQQIGDVPKKQSQPSESTPLIPQPPYHLSPYYAPSNSYSNIPYPLQGMWNYRNEFQMYPYPYYYPQSQ